MSELTNQAVFNRSNIVNTILEEISRGAAADYILYEAVRKPYTHVLVSVDGFEGLGFSKVSGTDEWSEQKGLEMARKRAVRHAVDGMIELLRSRDEI